MPLPSVANANDVTPHASQPAAGYAGDMLMLTGIWGGKETQLLLGWNAGLKDVCGTDHKQYSAVKSLVQVNSGYLNGKHDLCGVRSCKHFDSGLILKPAI